MKYKKLISFLAFFLAVLSVYGQNPFILKSGEPVTIVVIQRKKLYIQL